MIPSYLGTLSGLYLACALGVPAPEEITLLSTGAWVSTGQLALVVALLTGWAGVLTSDWSLYFLGRHLGHRIVFLPILRACLTQHRMAWAETLIQKNGPLWCAAARFIPGMRILIFATLGSLGLSPCVFMVIDAAASLISVSFWIFAGKYLAIHLLDTTRYASEIKLALAGIAPLFLTLTISRKLIIRK